MPTKPQQQQPQEPQYLDEFHQKLTEDAQFYFDDDEERETFFGTMMERRGYKPLQSTTWEPPEPQEPEPPKGPQGQPPKQQRAPYFKR